MMTQVSANRYELDGATVEIGTITHEGHEFSAHGSIVDTDNGLIIGYVRELPHGRCELTSWNGEAIHGQLRRLSTWNQRSTYRDTRMAAYAFTATDGRAYHGRKSEEYDLLHLNVSK